MIKLEKLRKSFNGRPVLRDLSFEARDGAITGLLGVNGAGKTTTLRAICGVLQPESGSVTIDDEIGAKGLHPQAVEHARHTIRRGFTGVKPLHFFG